MANKTIFLTIFGILMAQHSWACSVCFGDPTNSLSIGLRWGVWAMLGILATVLGAFIIFFLNLKKRAGSTGHL